ncbi:MAG: hypothetical protein M0R22_07570 [Dehalococcoidia bacterium]|nr:hypothetical protein [Dehalococcoidia bacterium]
MPSDERCETCAYWVHWVTPMDPEWRICRKFSHTTGASTTCGFWKPAPLPFDDEPVEEE